LSPARPGEQPYPMLGDSAMMRETQRRLGDTNLAVLDIEVVILPPEFAIDALTPLLDASATLGARYLLVNSEDPDEARATDNFRRVCLAARAYGIGVGLEFMIYRQVKTLPQAVRMVDAAASNAFVIVDTLHLIRSG